MNSFGKLALSAKAERIHTQEHSSSTLRNVRKQLPLTLGIFLSIFKEELMLLKLNLFQTNLILSN